jgi:hypothetical protein
MKSHSTNYRETFICVAPDCKAMTGVVPPHKNDKISAPHLQYEIISRNPYKYTSDDVLFMVHAAKNDLPSILWREERDLFFSKAQACFRASALTKQYGWGVHYDSEGKMALYGCETEAYKKFMSDTSIHVIPALRSKRESV